MIRRIITLTCLVSALIFFTNAISNAQLADNSLKLKLNNNFNKSILKSVNQSSDTAKKSGKYTPKKGFTLFENEDGEVVFSIFSYIRFLEQRAIDSSYTDSFGNTFHVQRRGDIQVNKVNIKFLGWFMDPKFKYLFYVWTNNTAQGQSAQVVVAGNLQYSLNKYFTFGAGINGLPGVRSTEGNFPFWLTTDNRLVSDEFFRPSYTTGIWLKGMMTDKLNYNIMAGNNLSQLGIDAGQLSKGLNTFSGALFWMPTTGEFGQLSDFGDFEFHKKAATRLGAHFTYSREDQQSQPNSSAFDNVTLRLSDGSAIFKENLFGSGINIMEATYKMTSFDAGFKYKGFALEGEFYYRWLSNFTGTGLDSLKFNLLTDKGFQLMASHMVLPGYLQIYSTFAQVFGGYGNPWDARFGINYFPWKGQTVRWNFEYIHLYKSPVGGLSLPYPVGGNGGIIHTDFMVNF